LVLQRVAERAFALLELRNWACFRPKLRLTYTNTQGCSRGERSEAERTREQGE